MLFVFFSCYRRPWLFSLSQAMTQSERSVKRKRRQNSNHTRIIAGSLSRPPPGYSKANLGITHTESLLAGYSRVCKGSLFEFCKFMSFMAGTIGLIDFPEKRAPTKVKYLLPVRQILRNFIEGNARKFTASLAFCVHVDIIKYLCACNCKTIGSLPPQ